MPSQLIFITLISFVGFLPAEGVRCEVPFEEVGSRCLFIDVHTGGTWQEVEDFCKAQLKGAMFNLDSLSTYSYVLEYLRAKGLSRYSFWTDGNDQVIEGHFFHKNTGYPVEMGTPFWAYDCPSQQECQQEPLGGKQENCVEMDATRFHYLNDVSCSSYKYVICQDY